MNNCMEFFAVDHPLLPLPAVEIALGSIAGESMTLGDAVRRLMTAVAVDASHGAVAEDVRITDGDDGTLALSMGLKRWVILRFRSAVPANARFRDSQGHRGACPPMKNPAKG